MYLYWKTFPNMSHFFTNTHLQPTGLTPFGIVSTRLNTFLGISSSVLMATSLMGQSFRLRVSAIIVVSQLSSKCCNTWKQKTSSRFIYVRSYSCLYKVDCNLCWCFSFSVIKLNAWKHTFACCTYLCLGMSFVRLKILTMTSFMGVV